MKAIFRSLLIACWPASATALAAPLLERVPAAECGLDFRNLFEEDGPRSFLYQAGFSCGQVGVYIMAGIPGQEMQEVVGAIRLVQDAGATPKINDYSPIPGTEEWQKALEISGREIETEPLWQNNNLYAARPESRFKPEDFAMLRSLARRGAEEA